MFKNLKNHFDGNAALEIVPGAAAGKREVMVACIALLAAISQSDDDFAAAELNSIATEMFTEFGVSQNDNAELLELANFMLRDGAKLDKFLNLINQHLDISRRELLLSMVWRIIIADGKAEKVEAESAAGIRLKLGLSLEQAVRARKLAQMKQEMIESFKALDQDEAEPEAQE